MSGIVLKEHKSGIIEVNRKCPVCHINLEMYAAPMQESTRAILKCPCCRLSWDGEARGAGLAPLKDFVKMTYPLMKKDAACSNVRSWTSDFETDMSKHVSRTSVHVYRRVEAVKGKLARMDDPKEKVDAVKRCVVIGAIRYQKNAERGNEGTA